MKKSHYTIRAFTLIEMLVVIAIIAILTGIVITNLTSSRAKARDAKRISDISQIQLALELYFDRCHHYPAVLVTGAATDCTTSNGTVNLSAYISQIPVPPTGTTQTTYDYYVNSNNPALITDFVLHAKLESYNDALKNGLSDTGKPGWAASLVTCYSASSNDYCMSSK